MEIYKDPVCILKSIEIEILIELHNSAFSSQSHMNILTFHLIFMELYYNIQFGFFISAQPQSDKFHEARGLFKQLWY